MPAKYTPYEIADEDDKILARVCGMEFGSCVKDDEVPTGYTIKRYTAFCEMPDLPGEYEEIDIDAVSARYAKVAAKMELIQGYEPGMRVARVEERFGLYM